MLSHAERQRRQEEGAVKQRELRSVAAAERGGGSPSTAETERTRSSSADRCVAGSPTNPKEGYTWPLVPSLVEYYLSCIQLSIT
jgi:hypothetical protein